MADVIYKLPLDPTTDNDLITWINSLPRNKKAEVIRHAIRFYKSFLKEGETFIMPPSGGSVSQDTPVVADTTVKKPEQSKKRPPAGLVKDLKNITKQ